MCRPDNVRIPEHQYHQTDSSVQFVQLDSAKPKDYAGTGLGLSISKKFCEMLGGTIMLDSKPGEGSAFTIELPRFFSEEKIDNELRSNYNVINIANS